jgi:hypothetical protein
MVAALDDLRKLLVTPDGAPIDPLEADWAEIERGVILLLGGAFAPQNPRHLEVVFMLAAALAERLRRELGAFWFQNRATPHGATLGFPGAVVVFSPIDTVLQALARARLGTLAGIPEELKKALAQGRGMQPGAPALGPEDYQRIFDPGLVQLVALDPAALSNTLSATTASIVSDFEHGFTKLSREIPEQARTQVTREIAGALRRLPGDAPVGDQIARSPQLVEFVALATATAGATGIAPLEFWEQLLFPLLHVGAADSFGDLDDEELAAYRQGADPLLLYIDVVPYKTPAADEDGLLGVFPPDGVQLVDPRFAEAQGARLLRLDVDVLAPLCAQYDAAAVRSSVERFAEACAAAAGGAAPQPPATPDRPTLRDMVLYLGEDVKRLVALVTERNLMLCLRYATESEAGSEPILQDLRRALREPRIILA